MYWGEILWLISWPLMIWILHLIITSAINKYEDKTDNNKPKISD